MSISFKMLLLCFVLLFTALRAEAQDQLTDSIHHKMLAYMQEHHIQGAAVEIYVHGVPHAYYFGLANQATNMPVTANTLFELGSITKIFTSLLLAEEVVTHRLTLQTPAARYFEDFDAETKRHLHTITLQELATHTVGFPLFLDATITTHQQLMRYLATWQPSQPIGSAWQYSNICIGLLGIALEGATHQSYNQLTIEHLLKPLHMTPVGLTVPPSLATHYAQGYTVDGQTAPRVNMPFFASAGAMKANGADMLTFLKAAIGLPGTPETLHKAMRLTQTPYVSTADKLQGLGWEIRPLSSHTRNMLLHPPESMVLGPVQATTLNTHARHYDGSALIEKTGATAGFRTYIALIPNQQTGIVILTNKHAENNDIVKLGRRMLLELAEV